MPQIFSRFINPDWLSGVSRALPSRHNSSHSLLQRPLLTSLLTAVHQTTALSSVDSLVFSVMEDPVTTSMGSNWTLNPGFSKQCPQLHGTTVRTTWERVPVNTIQSSTQGLRTRPSFGQLLAWIAGAPDLALHYRGPAAVFKDRREQNSLNVNAHRIVIYKNKNYKGISKHWGFFVAILQVRKSSHPNSK